jgi:AMMECR1 domain-containing protein
VPVVEDLASLECEVVVIKKSWPVVDTEAVDPATQGIIVEAGGLTSYVAPGEGGWDNHEAFSQACRRVGLSPQCWKLKKQEVVPTFTAFSGERFADWDPPGTP